jgi:hypothetical protein
MADPRYLRGGFDFQVAHVNEECGEVATALGGIVAAIGKAGRWGWESVNPELPPEQQEANRAWLARAMKAAKPELEDLLNAIERLEATMREVEQERIRPYLKGSNHE